MTIALPLYQIHLRVCTFAQRNLTRRSDVSLANAFASKNKESTALRYSRVISFPSLRKVETLHVGPSHYALFVAPYPRHITTPFPATVSFSIARGATTDNISVYNDKKQTREITRGITEPNNMSPVSGETGRISSGLSAPRPAASDGGCASCIFLTTQPRPFYFIWGRYHVSDIKNCLIIAR